MRAALSLLALIAVSLNAAYARLAVCNKAAHTATVALGRFNGTDWMSEGWWTIAPGKCTDLIGTPLDARYYYLYATDGGSGTWNGGTPFCTSARKFAIAGRGFCAKRGLDRKGFFRVDTNQAPDWTQSLSD